MADELYDYEAHDGTMYEGLSITEALKLKQQDEDRKKEMATEAQLGPQISAGIRAFESMQSQKVPMGGMASGSPAPAASPAPAQPSGNFGDASFMNMVDGAVKQQQAGNPFEAGTPTFDSLTSGNSQSPMSEMSGSSPYPGFTQGQMNKERQMSAPMMAMFDGVPPEMMNDLIARFRMGELKPGAFVKEITAVKKSLFDQSQLKKKSEYDSEIKMKETANEKGFDLQKNYDDIESKEKIAQMNIDSDERMNKTRSETDYENARQQQAALRAAEFDTKTKDRLIAVEEGKNLLSGIVDTFKASGFGNAGDAIGEGVAKIPFAGKFIAGKNKEYQNQKTLASETWLRAATGAAARPEEVRIYAGFLPNESDPPEIAQKKIGDFFNKISVKAAGNAKVLELEGKGLEKRGMVELASVKYEQANLIREMIDNARQSIPSLVEKENVNTETDDDIIMKYLGGK